MSSLDSFVQKIVTLEAGREHEILGYIKSNIESLKKHSSNQLDNAMQTIDVHRASHAILALLYAKVNNTVNDEELLIKQISEFYSSCIGEQIRPLGKYFAYLGHHFTDLLCRRREGLRGIKPMCTAVEKLQSHRSQLTSLHADLCQLCLSCGCFEPAIKFLGIDYTEINNEENYLDAKFILLFYHYGGCIYAAKREFSRALLYFELVLTIPAAAMSFIMVDAYKKMLLTSLIVHGKGEASLDVMISRYVRRQAQLLSQAYHELVQAFVSGNLPRLDQVIEKERTVFVTDKNLGLLKYVRRALIKQNIRKLARAYVTLSLPEIAKHISMVNTSQVAFLLAKMIDDGDLNASIDESREIVTFENEGIDRFEPNEATLAKINSEAQYLIEVLNQIKGMDNALETNQQWLKKIVNTSDFTPYV